MIVKASLILPFNFSLTIDALDDETFGLDNDELEDDDDDEEDVMDDEFELTGREGLELEVLSFSLLLFSFGDNDGFENVGEADFNWVILGLPRLVCFGDIFGCLGLPDDGLGLLLPLGEEV